MPTYNTGLFRTKKQLQLFLILCLATLFNLSMIGVRIYHIGLPFDQIESTTSLIKLRGTSTFLFLVWNLFLAWIPYLIAICIGPIFRRNKSKIVFGLLFFSWLFFFPNAPYIITDLLHLKSRAPIPHWYDLMLIASFAWTGLMLGLLSLYEIHYFIRQRLSRFKSWMIVLTCITLCGYGVYLGRYLRWNTWDLIARPMELATDIYYTLRYPSVYMETLGIAVVLSIFMLVTYLMLVTLKGMKREEV